MGKPLTQPTRPGLLPEARLLVLPEGICSTAAPSHVAVLKRLGVVLDPWQVDVSRLLWAKGADGQPAADTVCLSIPRQAGKTFLVVMNCVAHCLINPGCEVAWTAHHNKVMLETFNQVRNLCQGERLSLHVAKVNASAENRSVVFVNGSRLVMAARESGALRGVSKVGVLVLDEAQILSDSAMADMLPTQNTAKGAVTVMMGTPPKPGDNSETWVGLRNQALTAAKRDRNLDAEAWVEFGADPGCDTDDHAMWRKANPSFPKRTPLRAIRKLRTMLTEDHFRREALGIWDDLATPAVIPADQWESLADVNSRPVSRLVLGVDVSPARTTASVALAGLREDGSCHVELYERRAGVEWLLPWLVERTRLNEIAAVILDKKGQAITLAQDLRRLKITVIETDTRDMADACAQFFDAAMSSNLTHTGQPQLAAAVDAGRRRSIGDRWAWNRRSAGEDITPLVAASLACWGVWSRRIKDKNKRKGVVLSW